MATNRSWVVALCAALVSGLGITGSAAAHGGDGEPLQLHVGDWHDSCYFDLHSELTAEEFEQFAAYGGQVARFRQISAADTMGAGAFDVSLAYAYFFIDDSEGAWNNTMSHPEADHWLGDQLGFPQLHLRVGVTDRVDAEVYGTLNPGSNYGLVGGAAKIQILEYDLGGGVPFAVAVRPSVAGLIGPSEVQALNLATDVSMSVRFAGLAPFVGLSFSSTLAFDSSDDTDVGHQAAARTVAFAGLDYQWRWLSVGAQAEVSDLTSVSLRAGGRF